MIPLDAWSKTREKRKVEEEIVQQKGTRSRGLENSLLQKIIMRKLVLDRTLRVWPNNHLIKRPWRENRDVIRGLHGSREERRNYVSRDTASLS